MPQTTLYDKTGASVGIVELDDELFAAPVSVALLHQVVTAQLAGRRLGTHDSKTRGEVRGGGKKPYRQKGTGRARQGTPTAPHYRGGGAVFGPHPRSYAQRLPRQMKRLALRSALSSHAAGGTLIVVDGLAPEDVKTKSVQAALTALGVDRRALVISGEFESGLARAARNIDVAKALPAQNLNVVDLVNAHKLVMSEDAIRKCEALWGGANLKPARGRRPEAV